jgi:hypothetical protein
MKEVESFVCLFPLLKSLERKERDGWTDITPQYISGGGTAHYYGTLRISRFTYNATAGRAAATAARAIEIKFGLIIPSFLLALLFMGKNKRDPTWHRRKLVAHAGQQDARALCRYALHFILFFCCCYCFSRCLHTFIKSLFFLL